MESCVAERWLDAIQAFSKGLAHTAGSPRIQLKVKVRNAII
ncbi:hypothetical protein ACFCP7_25670 [Paenibacillus elgii]